jgi:hypothetical protein
VLPVILSNRELQDRGETLAENLQKTAQVENDLAAKSSEIKGQIKALKAVTSKLAQTIQSGQEERLVECEIHFDYRHHNVKTVRCDTGEVVSERTMNADELQTELFKEKGKGKPPEETNADKPKAEAKAKAKKGKQVVSEEKPGKQKAEGAPVAPPTEAEQKKRGRKPKAEDLASEPPKTN